jgi:uncharacterized protein YjbI with pentapeptide repeats
LKHSARAEAETVGIMESGQRWRRGLRWAAVGLLTGILATVLNAQATAARPASLGWAYWLQNTANLTKVVELAIFMFSGYQFWAGRRDRNRADVEGAEQARIDSIYQAWQVVNSAQGKGGSGGRIEALSDLLRQGVSLAGINLDGAWLEGVELAGATLVGADLREAILVTANLAGANLRGADLSGARLSAATLDGADLNDVVGWDKIASLSYASVDGVRNAPKGFLDFARGHGAVDHSTTKLLEDDEVSHSQHFRVV